MNELQLEYEELHRKHHHLKEEHNELKDELEKRATANSSEDTERIQSLERDLQAMRDKATADAAKIKDLKAIHEHAEQHVDRLKFWIDGGFEKGSQGTAWNSLRQMYRVRDSTPGFHGC